MSALWSSDHPPLEELGSTKSYHHMIMQINPPLLRTKVLLSPINRYFTLLINPLVILFAYRLFRSFLEFNCRAFRRNKGLFSLLFPELQKKGQISVFPPIFFPFEYGIRIKIRNLDYLTLRGLLSFSFSNVVCKKLPLIIFLFAPTH